MGRLLLASRARVVVACVVAVSGVLSVSGCGGDSRARDAGTDSFVFVDMARPDLGRPDAGDAGDAGDAMPDAPMGEGGADGGDGGDRDAGDTGPAMCLTPRDCPPGQLCVDGVCRADADCCDLIDCRPPATCDPFSCSCRASGGCCDTGFCDGDGFCDFDTCECMTFTCTPECAEGFVCNFGECYPDCFFSTPCPPTELCSFELGCVPPQCTNEECEAMSPPSRCDPSTGCIPTCVGDFSWCTSMGGRCFLDQCVDDSCGEREGMTPRFCTYVFDCCGNAVCQHMDDLEPFCPGSCGDPMPPPTRPDLCQCGFGFGGPSSCIDLRSGGFFPGPIPPDPGPVPPPMPAD